MREGGGEGEESRMLVNEERKQRGKLRNERIKLRFNFATISQRASRDAIRQIFVAIYILNWSLLAVGSRELRRYRGWLQEGHPRGGETEFGRKVVVRSALRQTQKYRKHRIRGNKYATGARCPIFLIGHNSELNGVKHVSCPCALLKDPSIC